MELERTRTGSVIATSGDVTCRCIHVYSTTKLKLMYEVCFSLGAVQHTITRTTDEYQNLHKLIKKDFTHLLPQFLGKFPTKLFGGANQVEKRVNFLAQFIQFIAKNEALHSHAHFQEFIKPHNAMLHFSIIAGRNLTVRDRNGLSDPFCRAAVYDSKKKAGKGYQTPIIKKTLNPVWKNPEVLTMEVDKRADSTGVTVSVMDHNLVASHAFMGRVTIPFTSIPTNRKIVRWFPVHHTKKHTSGDIHGELKLELHIISAGPPVSFDVAPLDPEAAALKRDQAEERRRRRHKKEQDRNAGQLHLQYLYNPPQGEWEGYLTVKVAGASGLPPPPGQKCPDPYVVLSMGATRERTKVRKNSDNPVWNEIHYFYVPPANSENEVKSFLIDVYDWNRIEKSIFIGSTSIVLEELVAGPVQDLQVILCGPPHTQKNVSKKLGRRMAEQGYTPNLPIVLVPGFASSGLRVVESSHKPWVNDRVWLSLNKIMSQNARKRLDVGRSKKCYDTIDFANKNLWIKHICLSPEDCRSDPRHIKVRAIQGKEAVTYLDPGLLTGSLSYVMGPLVENLCELGYNDNNLICAPYDWRVPFYYLEERDGYFSTLKVNIEAMARREKKKVVVLGHSMGNRIIQYFLNWAKLNHGQAWIDQNIHTFVAVGAPFLGAPKSVRGLISGDRFGMDLLLSNREAKGFARTLGSVPGLLPIGGKLLDDLNVGVVYTSQNGEPPAKVDVLPFLKEIGCAKTVEIFQNDYQNDPAFGGGVDEDHWPILGPPPVQRLLAIYGVNLETERLYFYKQGRDEREWVLDKNPKIDPKDPTWSQFSIKKGIAYETAETMQPTHEKMTGIRTFCAGDGTVTYASLTYCLMWKKDIKEVIVEELEGVEHREILNNRLFFKKLIEFIGDKPPTIKSPIHLTVRGKNYMRKYAKDVLEDVDDDESGADDQTSLSSSSSSRVRRKESALDDYSEDSAYVVGLHDDGAIEDGSAYEMI